MSDSNSDPRFHGIFSTLKELDIYDRTAGDIYAEGFADFWNVYTGHDVGDIPYYQRLLPGPGARVLDLGCGSGRIGIALARDGALVDGIELSSAMLALVDANLATETEEVKKRLRFFKANICDFSLPDRYDLIVLGATSISLLLRSEQRRALFKQVRNHLKPDGKFIFDILDFSGERWKKHDNYIDVWSRETEDGQDFAIVGQHFYPDEKIFTFNAYRELVEWNGTTKRTISSSTKAWIETDELALAIQENGLAITSEFDHGEIRYYVVCMAEGA
jgi:SAM-dependent methyltransferase